jgi:hypothetical protein
MTCQKASAAAAAIQHRTIPSAIFVKPDAVDYFNRLCERLTDGTLDEDTHREIILNHVLHSRGMTHRGSRWKSRLRNGLMAA